MSEPQKTELLANLIRQASSLAPKNPVVQAADAALKKNGDLASILGGSKPITNAETAIPRSAPAPVPAAPASAPVTLFDSAAPKATPATDILDTERAAQNFKQIFNSPPANGTSAPSAPPEDSVAAGIVPPDAPPPTSTPEEIEAANADKKAEETKKAEEPEKKRRGRRPKNETAPATPEEVQEAVAAAPFQAEAPDFDTTKTNEGVTPSEVPASVLGDVERLQAVLMNADPNFECGCEVLFIDTIPGKGWTGGPPTDLATMMHAFERIAAQSAKKPDYRMISYEAKGYLALAIKALMKGLPKAVYLDSRLPGADVFLSVVTPYAKMIFRGVR
jgi:hypothetical protein